MRREWRKAKGSTECEGGREGGILGFFGACWSSHLVVYGGSVVMEMTLLLLLSKEAPSHRPGCENEEEWVGGGGRVVALVVEMEMDGEKIPLARNGVFGFCSSLSFVYQYSSLILSLSYTVLVVVLDQQRSREHALLWYYSFKKKTRERG